MLWDYYLVIADLIQTRCQPHCLTAVGHPLVGQLCTTDLVVSPLELCAIDVINCLGMELSIKPQHDNSVGSSAVTFRI